MLEQHRALGLGLHGATSVRAGPGRPPRPSAPPGRPASAAGRRGGTARPADRPGARGSPECCRGRSRRCPGRTRPRRSVAAAETVSSSRSTRMNARVPCPVGSAASSRRRSTPKHVGQTPTAPAAGRSRSRRASAPAAPGSGPGRSGIARGPSTAGAGRPAGPRRRSAPRRPWRPPSAGGGRTPSAPSSSWCRSGPATASRPPPGSPAGPRTAGPAAAGTPPGPRPAAWPTVPGLPRTGRSRSRRHAVSEPGVQLGQRVDRRHRHQEVRPGVVDQPLDVPLLVRPPDQAEVRSRTGSGSSAAGTRGSPARSRLPTIFATAIFVLS